MTIFRGVVRQLYLGFGGRIFRFKCQRWHLPAAVDHEQVASFFKISVSIPVKWGQY